MWVFLNDAFFSIVEPSADDGGLSEDLLVRARFNGDIERVFPRATVQKTNNRDYAYRALISRTQVADAIASEVNHINYHNFKDSISAREKFRSDAYLDVWVDMFRAQSMHEYNGKVNWYEMYNDM